MNRKTTIPTTIFIIQVIGILYLLYQCKFGHPDIPVAFILLNFLAIFSVLILIASWFLHFKAKEKLVVWKMVVAISVATILVLICIYIWMGFDKYH